jgi:hypothetical protein
MLRSASTRVALDCSVLELDRAAHGVDHAAKFGEKPIPGALDHASSVDVDGRVDQITTQCPQPGERAILISCGETTETNYIGGENRRNFPGLVHGARID